jgi:tRNA G18 (ribose-2'-O)-methylase SpoU
MAPLPQSREFESINSMADPRVAAYRNLPDRTLRGEGVFVAEGRLLVERLLRSHFPTDSVLVIKEYAAEFGAVVPVHVPLYVADEALLREIVGFNFHQGALAAGRRTPLPSASDLAESFQTRDRQSLVVLPEVTKPENLGLIVRSAAALGVGGVLLGERCCDPLARRSLRLSMGSVFQVPLARSIDLAADLLLLKQQFGFTLFATVLDPDAEPLPAVQWPQRTAMLFGNEYDGLAATWLNLCDRRITIPMRPGVDSLNLGVAAGVFLYEMQLSVKIRPWS